MKTLINTIMNIKIKLSLLLFIGMLINSNDVLAQEFGIQLYSLREQFKEDVPKTIKLISSWGITKIEGGENTYGLPEGEFISLLKENNLETISVGTSFEELQESPNVALERAIAFGADYIMCPWIPHNGDDFTIDDVKLAVAVFNKAGKLFKEAGKELVYHPHGYEFRPYNEGTLFDYMVANAANFNFEMDVYWVQYAGEDPLRLLKKYPNKFSLMHLKDMKKGTKGNNKGHGDVETNVTLGKGSIDIKSLVKKGRSLGIKYMFIEDESSRVVKQVPESLSYLKKIN